ncbi:MAG: DNA mismatch repair endonuclease MutL [Lentimicrobiaceae bacterium]|nr:DNA mismatch repair endonuclease MutL [Lentimicrobiaceae bacterium]
MPDLIHVLPDHVANQIAAGEVVQRPASVVKELMENAVDAGATTIDLIVKDAGRTLVQVTDNGCGMTENDAVRCFQRHATSKILAAEDLFAIRTMGFRGEALASIAAISQLELKTRRAEDDLGVMVEIDGGKIMNKSAVACAAGTTISVKNIFYNLPARRKFLKSNTAELRHIVEEFIHIALIRTNIQLSLFHNGKNIYKLAPSPLKQRIIALFGQAYKERLIPVHLETDYLKVDGYIAKPEFSRKTRGEQYFFANKRFIRHPYLHHSVVSAYQDLIAENTFPAYFLMLDVHPASLDVNIHPTKTEVKFEDEKMIYAMLRSAIRQALGQHNLMPSLEFDRERSFELPPGMAQRTPVIPQIKINPDYNPFENTDLKSERDRRNRQEWMRLFSTADRHDALLGSESKTPADDHEEAESSPSTHQEDRQAILPIQDRYIITGMKSGVLIIHQKRAWERIYYELLAERYASHHGYSQQQLFPQTISLPPADASILRELIPDLTVLGFEIRELSGDDFIVDGVPEEINQDDIAALMDGFIQEYKDGLEPAAGARSLLIKALAVNLARQEKPVRDAEGMYTLIDRLFACEAPEKTPSGKVCYILMNQETLDKHFK